MVSEKLRYNRRYMEENPRTDIELTPLKTEIEAISSESNINEDCDTIARLLSPYREVVRELLSQGNYAEAITILLEVLESLTYHFVEDEHYNYFDDVQPRFCLSKHDEGNHQCYQKRKFPSGRIASVERGIGKAEAFEGIRGLRCAVCVEYMEEKLAGF
ncbi:putative uncharacterized protein [Prevotella sp. CAG:255]|nr:putative uncharacterized protein [Prevotella sp. CAG:255]